jgi:hypothetical protein
LQPYRLAAADRSVKLAALLFLLVIGLGYAFSFMMVRTYAGLSPSAVQATYVPPPGIDESTLPANAVTTTQRVDLGSMTQEQHTVDRDLLVQDSHVHLLMYAVIAALLAVIILGLDWPAWLRETMIVAAFGFGALDFTGQWLMHLGAGVFAYLTITAGWGMAAVYLIVLYSTIKVVLARQTTRRQP